MYKEVSNDLRAAYDRALDEQIKAITCDFFAVRDFKAITTPDSRRSGIHYQRLILQKGKD